MILVLVGTNPYSFERLVKCMDSLVLKHKWDVFIQLGNTPYIPKHCEYTRFIEKDEILKKIDVATVVICHGGFGSIRDVLASGKMPVVVPRLQEFDECNDYQLELVKELESINRVLPVYEIDKLEAAIFKAPDCSPEEGETNKIPIIIQAFLDENV